MAAADHVEANLDKALEDLRLYDLAVDLHGSRALGFAQPGSNVDVLCTRPLEGLLSELQGESKDDKRKDQRFKYVDTIPCSAPWYQPPRLLLQHVPTGVQLDLISRWSADIFVRERDAVTKACMAYDEKVQPFLELVLKWSRKRKDQMPADEGNPNSYCFRLMALHFLMYRVIGILLPPLTKFGAFLNEKDERYAAVKNKDKALKADELVIEFLDHLGKSGKPGNGLWADLRDPAKEGQAGVWQVVDPVTHKGMMNLKDSQILEIAKMAKVDGKAMRDNKGALDNL
jgi:hypothetical protein